MALIGTLMTPRIDAKIRKRLFTRGVLNDKYPDFKDILRERFKSKIKQNRRALFQQMRSFHDDCNSVQDILCDYLKNEIDDISNLDETSNGLVADNFCIENELEAMKQIELELVEEQLNWVMEEYGKEEKHLNDEVENESLCCPICQRGFLYKNDKERAVFCTQCSIHLFTAVSLEKLKMIISENVNEHSNNCRSNPLFTVISEPNTSGLFMVCYTCSWFNALC